MLDYRSIRARYELAIRDALLPLDVPLHYDNVQEQPIPEGGSIEEYATITISFPSSTEPDICGGVVSDPRQRSGQYARSKNGRDAQVGADGRGRCLRVNDDQRLSRSRKRHHALRQHSRSDTDSFWSRSAGYNCRFSAFYSPRRIDLTCRPAGAPPKFAP